MTARIGVVLFPGSNCEQDVIEAFGRVGADARLLWHGDTTLGGTDAVIVPGGFAHGDYLRPGAIARFSPIMNAVARFAADGGPVVGICAAVDDMCTRFLTNPVIEDAVIDIVAAPVGAAV